MTRMNKISIHSIPMALIFALSLMSSLCHGRNLQSLSPRAAPKYPPREAPDYPPWEAPEHAPIAAPEYAPVESPDVDLSPEASNGYYDFLDECSKDLSPMCGEELFGGVFANATVSNKCCRALVYLGQDCHDGLVETIIEIAVDGDEEKAMKYRERSVEVWNECVLEVSDDLIIAAPPVEDTTQKN